MPILGSFGGGSATGFGQRRGGKVIYQASYLVVAGGGGGGGSTNTPNNRSGGGGGAGGYRNSYATEQSGDGSSTETPLEFIGGTVYTVTVRKRW